MHYTKTIILYFLIVASLSSCIKKENTALLEAKFFDLKGFMEKEISSLQKNNAILHSTTRLGEEVSDSTTLIVDWEKQLGIFKSFDINKNAFLSQYSADSIWNKDKSVYHLVYESNNPKLTVSSLQIMVNAQDHSPILIKIASSKDAFFFKEDLLYSYQPGSSYGIIGTRKPLFSEEIDIEIAGEINLP
jgi:hypothetical protein